MNLDTHSEQRRLIQVFRERFVGRSAERWSSVNNGNRWIDRERLEETTRLLRSNGFWPLHDLDVLDIGCGGGGQLARLLSQGSRSSTPARHRPGA